MGMAGDSFLEDPFSVLFCSCPLQPLGVTGQGRTRGAAFLVGLKGEGESVSPGGKVASIVPEDGFRKYKDKYCLF